MKKPHLIIRLIAYWLAYLLFRWLALATDHSAGASATLGTIGMLIVIIIVERYAFKKVQK